MPHLPDDQKNPALNRSAVHRVLPNLTSRGISARGSYASSFAGRHIRESPGEHYQGITRCPSTLGEGGQHFFATTSAERGLLLHGTIKDRDAPEAQYVVDGGAVVELATGWQSTKPRNVTYHPGGIQAIGQYVAVPVYVQNGDARSEIQIWSHDLERRCAFAIPDKRAYCLGITNIGDTGYLLAVVVEPDGREIRLYWNDKRLTHAGFRPVGTALLSQGYPNSISLLADVNGGAYLLGLYLRGEAGVGADCADLYGIAPPNTRTGIVDTPASVHRIGEKCHLTCTPGMPQPCFRWGASARVVSDTEIEVVAIGLETYEIGENDKPVFDLNTFKKNAPSLA